LDQSAEPRLSLGRAQQVFGRVELGLGAETEEPVELPPPGLILLLPGFALAQLAKPRVDLAQGRIHLGQESRDQRPVLVLEPTEESGEIAPDVVEVIPRIP
jgi:hypothetical protein